MSKILISYRHKDSADVTGRIDDRLVQQFGRESVFKDVDSIPPGVDFRKYLDAQVAKCQVFLAVIGPDWMKTKSGKGKSSLEDPNDFVRIEIELALKREIPVIPVLVRGASIPAANRLPESMKDLAYRHGITIRADPDFHRDMDRLIEYVKAEAHLLGNHRAEKGSEGIRTGQSGQPIRTHLREVSGHWMFKWDKIFLDRSWDDISLLWPRNGMFTVRAENDYGRLPYH